ncbi:MAG: 4-hydroxy-3-methylbut-2-enyl diphosphate reductase [Candidatus Diapherotrites archaeon]
MSIEKVLLIQPRGFCAGVTRAIEVVEQALQIFGAPVYVKHEIVHNKTVVESLKQKGAVFVETISEIPENAVCIYSAHGVPPSVLKEAAAKNLTTIDATCPLVTKVHLEVQRYAREGKEIIYIGHKGHAEAEGVLGVRPDITHLVEKPEDIPSLQVQNPHKLVYLNQTTFSIDECKATIEALKAQFPLIESPPADDICYATTNRQTAIKQAAPQCDVMLIVGSQTSSNSKRLAETARKQGVEAYLVDSLKDVDMNWFVGKKVLGLSAGASAPEHLVEEIASHFQQQGAKLEELKVIDEHMKFVLPKELEEARKR